MSRILTVWLLLVVAALPIVAWAGGSDAAVVVVSFEKKGDFDYTLVVNPTASASAQPYPDPYMGRCATFTVKGTYSRLAGFALTSPPMVTKQAHLDALEYLRKAATAHSTINLGWMGRGFSVTDRKSPCVVQSRALVMFTDNGRTSVVSFYDAI